MRRLDIFMKVLRIRKNYATSFSPIHIHNGYMLWHWPIIWFFKLTSQSPDTVVMSKQPEPEPDPSNIYSSSSETNPGIWKKKCSVENYIHKKTQRAYESFLPCIPKICWSKITVMNCTHDLIVIEELANKLKNTQTKHALSYSICTS